MDGLRRRFSRQPTDGPADARGLTPGQVIRSYIAIRREWDYSTMEAVTGWRRGTSTDPFGPMAHDDAAAERAWSALRTIREAWCTARVVPLLHAKESYGSASDFNPDDLVITAVKTISTGRVAVRTTEYPSIESGVRLPSEYEYVLVDQGGEWRLDSRSMRDNNGGRIQGLL